MKSASSLLILALSFWSLAAAEVYQWTDEDGKTRVSSRPPADAKDVKVFKGRPAATPSPSSRAPAATPQKASPPPASSPTVELYTTTWCPYCIKARRYLEARGVPFSEYDVEKDPAAARRMAELGGSGGVPFAVIGGRPAEGFSPDLYDRLLSR